MITLALVMALVGAWVLARIFLGYRSGDRRKAERPLRILRPGEAAFLDAAADTMFPADGAIPLSGRDADLPVYVDGYLATLPSHLRTQIRALLFLFEHATVIFPAPGFDGLRRFSSLSLDQRIAVFSSWRDSALFLRRLPFTALRAVLTMGYLGDPVAMRHLGLAPYDFASPVCEADLLYPAIGAHPDTLELTADDLTAPSDGTPLDLAGPLHPSYAASGAEEAA